MKKTLAYIKNFIKDKHVASITPSSKFCVRRVCKHIDFTEPRTIVEFGPGTGVYTRYILQNLLPGSTLHALELNENFVEELKKIPNKILHVHHAGAGELATILDEDENAQGSIDYIISGIPFSFLDEDERSAILDMSYRYLKQGGLFLAYQTSGHLKKPLQNHFDELSTEYEMLNIPPMVVYKAVKI